MGSDRVAGFMAVCRVVASVALVVSCAWIGPGASALSCAGEEVVVTGEAAVVEDTSVTFEVLSIEVRSDDPDADLLAGLAPGSLVEVGYPGSDGAHLEVGEEYLFPVHGLPATSSVPYERQQCGGGTVYADGSFVADPPLWSQAGLIRLLPFLVAVGAALGIAGAVRSRVGARRRHRRAEALEARIAAGDDISLPGRR